MADECCGYSGTRSDYPAGLKEMCSTSVMKMEEGLTERDRLEGTFKTFEWAFSIAEYEAAHDKATAEMLVLLDLRATYEEFERTWYIYDMLSIDGECEFFDTELRAGYYKWIGRKDLNPRGVLYLPGDEKLQYQKAVKRNLKRCIQKLKAFVVDALQFLPVFADPGSYHKERMRFTNPAQAAKMDAAMDGAED